MVKTYLATACLRLLFALFLSCVLLGAVSAQAQQSDDPIDYANVRGWEIKYIPAIRSCGAFNGRNTAEYAFVIMQSIDDYSWHLALFHPQWMNNARIRYYLRVYVDRRLVVAGNVVSDNGIVSIATPPPEGNERVSRAVVKIYDGREIYFLLNNENYASFSLSGSAAAMLKVTDCNNAYRARRQTTTERPAQSTEQARAQIPISQLRPMLNNLLVSLGEESFTMTPESDGNGMSFSSKSGTNGVILGLLGNTVSVAEARSFASRELGKYCNGDVVHATKKIPTVDGSVCQIMTTRCNATDSTGVTTISTFHRRPNGRLVIFHYHAREFSQSFRMPDQNLIQAVFGR